MAAKKKKVTLKFNKNKTVADNYSLLEKYFIKLDSTFGNILKDNINEDVNVIREKIKNDVNDLIN